MDVTFIIKCWSKKIIKKRPEIAIANFLIIEVCIRLLITEL